MPELPEVETVCRTLRPFIAQRTITACSIQWGRTVAPLDPDWFREEIAGEQISAVERRAKFIVMPLTSGRVMTVHLRMTGELLYVRDFDERDDDPRSAYLRATFRFDNGDHLLFYDTRKFGRIQLMDSHDWDALDRELGVEPLSGDFTPKTLHDVLRTRRRQLKPLLLDQTVVAGLGNIYVDEALFLARLHPLQPAHQISARKARDLREAIVQVLSSSIENRGTTLRDYRVGTGQQGENQRRLLIYGTKDGAPCPRCGRPIRHTTVGQRGTSFCPRCQPLRTPASTH